MNPNHPANNVERKGDYLEGKNIWLGITGSVSCVETIGPVSYTHLTLPTICSV